MTTSANTAKRGPNLAGYLLVALSAVTFSAKGIFAKIIYAHGVDPITLLALRFAMTMPLFWLTLHFYPSGALEKRDVPLLLVIGLTGFYSAALLDFYGLLHIEATLERLIIYTYPAAVVILAAVFLKERVGPAKVVSIVLTYAGLAVSLRVWKGGGGGGSLLGAGLVFSAAALYSVSYIVMEVLGRRVSAIKISTWATTIAGAAFIATWHFRSWPTEPVVWLNLAGLAVVSTYLPILTLLPGIKMIGASRSALASFVGPVSTALLAMAVLGETFDRVEAAGMAVVIAGVVMLTRDRHPRPRP
ncbi:MAG: DMT family transporter [Thermodesulfobacteriota bacterium]